MDGMTTSVPETDPVAERVEFTENRFTVHLADGRSVSIPVEWFPRLVRGTAAERANCRIIGEGYAIEWPDLDEHIGIEGLLAGRRSGESDRGLKRWLADRQGR